MSATDSSAPIDLAHEPGFALGGLEVRPSTRELVAGGQAEVLEPRVMQVLAALARRRGQVVSRDDLIQACWGGRAVGEDAINRCIQAIRKLAEAHGGFGLTTIPRVGYRLEESALPFAKPAQPLLAVLAFDNLSGDPGMAWFSDGISEEILQTVAQGDDLKVIGRGSSFQFRGPDKAARNVAAQLNATHILDGSVRRSSSRVRITAQLVECATEVSLWSDRFDRDLTDIFALQDDIAGAVARALRIAFAPSATPGAIDPEIYELYLLAQERFTRSGLEAKVESIAMLTEVVSSAPRLARAWAFLALVQAMTLLLFGQAAAGPGTSRASVRAAAETALGLDPAMGLADLALSYLEPFGHYRAREAIILRAFESTPNEVEVLVGMAWFSSQVGRWRQGLTYAHAAFQRDPLYWGVAGVYVHFLGDPRESLALAETFRARWPDHAGIAGACITLAARCGDWPLCDTVLAAAGARTSEPSIRGATWFARQLRSGHEPALAQRLAQLRDDVAVTGTVALRPLHVLSELGCVEQVFQIVAEASFDHAFQPAGPALSATANPGDIFSPSNSAMRSDPRFVGLCAKIGLVDYWITTNNWPDCADEGELPYDLKAECRRLAAEPAGPGARPGAP